MPSFLGLYYKLFIFCSYNDIKNNIGIIYFANIYKNRYFSCIEYLNLNESIQLGLMIYKKNKYIERYNISIFNTITVFPKNKIKIREKIVIQLIIIIIFI